MAVSITELAQLAAAAVGLDVSSRIEYRRGPIGVQARSADLSAAAALGWAPRVPLAEGLRRTGSWLLSEVERIERASGSAWNDFALGSLTSPHARVGDVCRFGLLVPVTSRMRGRSVELGLQRFLASFRETAFDLPPTNSGVRWQFDIVFGVDGGDAVCDPSVQGSLDLPGLVRSELPLACATGQVTARVRAFSIPPGSVCRIWADLAADCFDAGCDYTVLVRG